MIDFKHALNTFVVYNDLYSEGIDEQKVLNTIWETFENSEEPTCDHKYYYKQIFIEIENDSRTKCLYNIVISYSEKFNTFRIDVSDMQADKDENGDYPIIYNLKILDTPNMYMFKDLIKFMLEFIKPYVYASSIVHG